MMTRKKRVSVQLDPKLYDIIARKAEEDDRSVSSLIAHKLKKLYLQPKSA